MRSKFGGEESSLKCGRYLIVSISALELVPPPNASAKVVSPGPARHLRASQFVAGRLRPGRSMAKDYVISIDRVQVVL